MASYAILRFSKRKAGGVASADRHNERKKAAYKSNPNIDRSRSKYNYHLVEPSGTYKEGYSNRIAAAGCKTRSNSVVLVETLITASPDFINALSPLEQKHFFERAVEFIGLRVGKQNIISAVVHMDETTPHMHLSFCPITSKGKLSAKDLLGNRADLSAWQDSFYEHMAKEYPQLSRGLPAYVTHRKHIPVYVFKQATELDQAYPKIMEALEDINALNSGKKRNEALKVLNQYTGKIKSFTNRLKETEDYIRDLEKAKAELEKHAEKQGEKLENLEIDFLAQESRVKSLYSQMDRMQALLDQIPPEIVEKASRKSRGGKSFER